MTAAPLVLAMSVWIAAPAMAAAHLEVSAASETIATGAPAPHQVAPQQRVLEDGAPDTARVRRILEDRIARDPAAAAPYLELARFEMSRDDRSRAELILRTGLTEASRDPDVADLRRGLVELLAMSERWLEALQVLEAGASEASGDLVSLRARILVAVAVEARGRNELEEAETALREATTADPEVREAWIELTSLLLEKQRRREARATAEKGLRHHPQEPSLLLMRASTLDGRERVGETVEALELLRAERPGDVDVALSLAGHRHAGGDPSGAMALHDTLMAVSEPEARVFRHVAEFWLGVGDADSARVTLDRGVTVHPTSSELWALLGQAREELGTSGAAAEAFRRAATVSEPGHWLELNAARVDAQSGRLDEARAGVRGLADDALPLAAALVIADRAVAWGEPEAALWTLRRTAVRWGRDIRLREAEAHVALELGDTAAAMQRFESLAQEGSLRAVHALRSLGEAREVTRNPDVLRASIRSGIERIAASEEGTTASESQNSGLSATSAESLIQGRVFLQAWAREELDRDRTLLESLVEEVVFETEWGPSELGRLRGIHPGSLFLARVDARLALAQGDLEQARGEIERLLHLQPGNAEVHALHGAVLHEQGHREEARRAFGRAFELHPSAPEPFGALLRLHRENETLPALLSRIRRLRAMQPDDAPLLDREIEVLHRLGRLEEARALSESPGGEP